MSVEEETTNDVLWISDIKYYADMADKIIKDNELYREATGSCSDFSQSETLAFGIQKMNKLLSAFQQSTSEYEKKYDEAIKRLESQRNKLVEKIQDMREAQSIAYNRNMNASGDAFGIAIAHLNELLKEF